jgi:hypothetical protein
MRHRELHRSHHTPDRAATRGKARDADGANLQERDEEKGERMEVGGVVGGWERQMIKKDGLVVGPLFT